MRILTKLVETYEVSDEADVKALIEETRAAANGEYTLDYKSKFKEVKKTTKGVTEIIDTYWIVELAKKMIR